MGVPTSAAFSKKILATVNVLNETSPLGVPSFKGTKSPPKPMLGIFFLARQAQAPLGGNACLP